MTWHDPYGYTPQRTSKRKVLGVRYRIPQWTTGSPTMPSLATILRNMNPIVRGWSYFFRCGVANRIRRNLYRCVEDRLWRWTRKTHPEAGVGDIVWYLRRSSTLRSRKVWREGKEEQFVAGRLTLWRYQLARMRRPAYAMASAEPSA